MGIYRLGSLVSARGSRLAVLGWLEVSRV